MSDPLRADLAAAADTVLGEGHCSEYYRQTAKPGDAWVTWPRMDRDDTGLGFMESWQVRVVLPQNLADAEEWADDNAAAMVDALGAYLTITAVYMATLAMDTGPNYPGLVVEGVRPN